MPALSAKGLHPNTQLIILIGASVMALYLSNPVALAVMLFFMIGYAISLVSSAIMLKIYTLLFVLNAIMLFSINSLAHYIPNYVGGSLISQSIPFLRMAISISASVAIAFATPIDQLFLTLQKIGMPKFITLPLSIAIRFIPTFIDDIKQLRDVNYIYFNGLHPFLWLFKPIKLWRGFCVPLVFRTFHSSDALAISAELKGIGQGKPVIKKENLKKMDYFYLLLAFTAVIITIYLEKKLGPTVTIHGGRR